MDLSLLEKGGISRSSILMRKHQPNISYRLLFSLNKPNNEIYSIQKLSWNFLIETMFILITITIIATH